MSMSCDYTIPMSRELLSDTDIESLTAEFGAKVGFNSVELQGFRGMVRKAVNAADVTRHKVKRIFTSKHDPTRNNGLDNAKDRRDNENLYKYDKRQLKNDELTERMQSRSQRREADQLRAQRLRDIKDKRDERNDERKNQRNSERGKYAHHENNSDHMHRTTNRYDAKHSSHGRNENSFNSDADSDEVQSTQQHAHSKEEPYEKNEQQELEDLERYMSEKGSAKQTRYDSKGVVKHSQLYPDPIQNEFVVDNVYLV